MLSYLQPSDLMVQLVATDFLRYFLAAGAAYLFFWVIFFEKWQHRVIQRKKLQSKKMWMEVRYSLSTLIIFAIVGTGVVLAKKAGYTLLYDDFREYGWIWALASFALAILIHDAYFYWMHRLMHHPKIFRHVHLVHHMSTNPSPWAAYSFHPIEAVVEAGILPLLVFLLPLHTGVLFVFLLYMITRNVLGHLGIEFLPKAFVHIPFLKLHTTTTHHDLHHKESSSNFGLYFTWWDRWCGTEHKRYRETFEEVTTRES